jgi:hypothetical protein
MRLDSSTILIASGAYALACIPAIYAAEHFDWPEWPLHSTQLVAVAVCALASARHLWVGRGSGWPATRVIAALACGATVGWLGFVAVVIATLDFSGF